MSALELCRNTIDRAFDSEWLAAADAKRGLFFLYDLDGRPGSAKINLRLERNDVFRTSALAQSALYAGVFDEF